MHNAEKAHNTALDDENMTCIVVTVLCNQPKAFASDLVDDQSLYLWASRCSKNRSMWKTLIASDSDMCMAWFAWWWSIFDNDVQVCPYVRWMFWQFILLGAVV